MGFVDLFDNWKINPKYFEVSPFENRFAKVRFGDKYGMINCQGIEVVPPEFDELSFFSFGRIWAKKAEKWYLWDSIGNNLTEKAFDSYERTSVWHTYTWVNQDKRWFVIDENTGKRACDKSFTTIKILSDTLSLVSDDSYYGVFNHKHCRFKIAENIVSAQKVSSRFIKLRYRNKKFDIINLAGESILEQPYDEIISAGNGLAKVKLKEKWGLIKPDGDLILKTEYDSIGFYRNDRLALQKSGKWFYLNEKGIPESDKTFDKAGEFHGKTAIVGNSDRYFLINKSLEPLYKNTYDRIFYHHGIFIGRKESKWQVVSDDETQILFDEINKTDALNQTRTKSNGNWGVYDFENKSWRVPAQYSQIDFLGNDLLKVTKNGVYGIITIDFKNVIAPEYVRLERLLGFNHTLFSGFNGSVYRLLDLKNKVILESTFEINRQDKLFTIKDDKNISIWDETGTLILKDKFDSVIVMGNSKYLAVLKKSQWTMLDYMGQAANKETYNRIKVLSDQHVILENQGGESGIFHANGERITDADKKIDEVIEELDKTFLIKSNGKTELINIYGKSLINNIEDYKKPYSDLLLVELKGMWYIYDQNGRKISDKEFNDLEITNDQVFISLQEKTYRLNPNGSVSLYLPFDR